MSTRIEQIRTGAALALLAALAMMAPACIAAPVRSAHAQAVDSCRASAPGWASSELRWVLAPDVNDRAALDAWCHGVGPASSVIPSGTAARAADDGLAVVSWNVNVGAGDLPALVADLRNGRLTGGRPARHFVLLLQEALRRSPAVPRAAPGQAGAQRLVRALQPVEIETFAREAGLFLLYVPSMRNGFQPDPPEDRGNAIVATLPLSEPQALELPFERQRRVAVSAVIDGLPHGRLTVVSVHLDHLANRRRLWLWGVAEARLRQTRALVDSLPATGPLVVGGDFNTWLGVDEPAVAEMRRISNPIAAPSEPTFINGRVLDYLFFRLPTSAPIAYERASHHYGSDHFPLIGWLDAPAHRGVASRFR